MTFNFPNCSAHDSEIMKIIARALTDHIDGSAFGIPIENNYRAKAIYNALTAKGYMVLPVDCLEAFNRQADNMAFVVNHCDLKNWYEKFKSELEQDRATFAARVMIAVKE